MTGCVGSGPITRRRANRRSAGPESRVSATPSSWNGSSRYEPDVVISGHIHQSPFVAEGSWIDRLGSTWVFNAGRQYGAPPAYIVVDTTLEEALWVSAMGAQSVRLNGPLERPIPALRALPDWFEPPPVPAF